jgi:hypothetical protein
MFKFTTPQGILKSGFYFVLFKGFIGLFWQEIVALSAVENG